MNIEYTDFEELPTIPQDPTPQHTHLDKQLEYIKERGILVEEDQLNRMVNTNIYTKAQEQSEEETHYFIDSSYNTGFIVNESSVSWRSKHLIIKGKKKASLIANKLNLYHDMLIRAYELGYNPDDIYKSHTTYGIRYDFHDGSDGKLYVISHSNIQVFVFGIVFRDRSTCETLLSEFEDRIKLYY